MCTNGIKSGGLSEENRKALQSETWETARNVIKTEPVHFTDAPEMQRFTVEKFDKNDHAYGIGWGEVVREYLLTAYEKGESQAEIVSGGKTYKVLSRGEVTSFYDADGNTLFDVENKRLEKEHGWLVNDSALDAVEDIDAREENPKTGVTPPEGRAEDDPGGIPGLTNGAARADAAKKKYESSLKACKPHEKRYFEGPVKEHMLNRFEEDGGFCEDFLQGHKTFQKCIKYMVEKARASVPKSEMQAMVEGSTYLEWMEDYFHKDDKAEEEEKARKAAERKEKQKTGAGQKAPKENVKRAKAVTAPEKKDDAPKEQPKQKRSNKDMDGQLDMFSMIGM